MRGVQGMTESSPSVKPPGISGIVDPVTGRFYPAPRKRARPDLPPTPSDIAYWGRPEVQAWAKAHGKRMPRKVREALAR